jgi:hypothetical protein
LARNSVHYTRRNHPAFLASTLAMLLAQSARFLVAGAFGNFGFAIRGIADGCFGRTGRPDPMPPSRGGKPNSKAGDAPKSA